MNEDILTIISLFVDQDLVPLSFIRQLNWKLYREIWYAREAGKVKKLQLGKHRMLFVAAKDLYKYLGVEQPKVEEQIA
jgi:hypothetical protein